MKPTLFDRVVATIFLVFAGADLMLVAGIVGFLIKDGHNFVAEAVLALLFLQTVYFVLVSITFWRRE